MAVFDAEKKVKFGGNIENGVSRGIPTEFVKSLKSH